VKNFALAVALSLSTPAAVFAAGSQTMCHPMASLQGIVKDQGAVFKPLSPAQWQFIRGVYMMNPTTPPGLPYGNGATLLQFPASPGGGGMIIFLDGDKACTPMPIPKELVDVLADVGKGKLNHEGTGL
jgi:hypothetical protein